MTAQGEDILAWIESAIAEREKFARAVGYDRLQIDAHNPAWGTKTVVMMRGDARKFGQPNTKAGAANMYAPLADHIALHDPESVLLRCAADRKLLALHGGRAHSCPAYDYDGDLDEVRFYDHEVCPVVQGLAEGYGWTEGQR